jgi:hypothetical protein
VRVHVRADTPLPGLMLATLIKAGKAVNGGVGLLG